MCGVSYMKNSEGESKEESAHQLDIRLSCFSPARVGKTTATDMMVGSHQETTSTPVKVDPVLATNASIEETKRFETMRHRGGDFYFLRVSWRANAEPIG